MPGEYNGDFESIGMVWFTVWPEANYVVVDTARDGDPVRAWRQDEVRVQQALDSAYVRAQEMGADAITHFDIQSVTSNPEPGLRLEGTEVSGFLIDRQD